MAGNQVRIGVGVTGAKGAASELDQLRDKFSKLQSQGAKGLAIGVGAAVAVKAFNLLGEAVGGVTDFLGESVHAYQNAEESQARLGQSLKENIAGWTGNADAMAGAIHASEKLGFTNTETADSLALLVGATHDAAKAQNMLTVAQDYARFKNIGLLQAATDLTKVEGGSTRALKALGINLHTGATEAERMAAIMKVVGGQAQAYAETDLGKLAAANETVNEAQVKMGKGLANLEARILPAAADAVSGFADDLDDLSYQFGHLGETLPDATKINDSLGPFFKPPPEHVWGPTISSMQGLSHWAGKVADDFGVTGAATTNLSRDIQMGSGHIQAMGASFRIAEMEAGGLDSAIAGLSSTIDDELFGKAITAGHLADLRQTHKDLAKQREEVQKGTPKWKILTGQIAENEQAQFDLQLQMKQKEGPRAVIDWLKKQKQLFGDATGAIQKLIDKELRLITVNENLSASAPYSDGGPKSVVHKHRASGGPVSKGVAYTVGEAGPETFVAPGNGTIIPNGGGGAGGGMQMIPIPVPMSWTPSQQQAWAAEAGPAMARWMQQRGLVARGGAF